MGFRSCRGKGRRGLVIISFKKCSNYEEVWFMKKFGSYALKGQICPFVICNNMYIIHIRKGVNKKNLLVAEGGGMGRG